MEECGGGPVNNSSGDIHMSTHRKDEITPQLREFEIREERVDQKTVPMKPLSRLTSEVASFSETINIDPQRRELSRPV